MKLKADHKSQRVYLTLDLEVVSLSEVMTRLDDMGFGTALS